MPTVNRVNFFLKAVVIEQVNQIKKQRTIKLVLPVEVDYLFK